MPLYWYKEKNSRYTYYVSPCEPRAYVYTPSVTKRIKFLHQEKSNNTEFNQIYIKNYYLYCVISITRLILKHIFIINLFFKIQLLILFSVNLVKLRIIWLLENRDFHSFRMEGLYAVSNEDLNLHVKRIVEVKISTKHM